MADLSRIISTTKRPKTVEESRRVTARDFNKLIDELENGGSDLTTGDLAVAGDLTVTGATTLNGTLTLGDAAADALTVNATTTYAEPVNYANATAITAFATGGQTSATALTEEINDVTVCATAGDSVKLPAAVAGKHVYVKNSGATALDIFPASADSIDALAINLAVRIQPGSSINFYAKNAVVWESDKDASLTLSAPTTVLGQLELKATDSAGNTVTTITNRSQAAARTYSVPDAGGDADFVMTGGAQNVGGVKTLTNQLIVIDGVVGTPSIATTTTGHGLYEVSTVQLGFSVAGALASLADTSGLKSDSLRARVELGTAGTGVTAVSYGDGRNFTTELTFTDYIVAALAGAAAAKVLVPSEAIYIFPAGAHVLEVSFASLALTAAGTAVTPDVGLGSVVGDGSANAVLSASAAGAEDIMTGFPIADTDTHAVVNNGPVGATAGILTDISLNAVGGVKNVFLNAAATWNADNTGNLTATGTITLKWTLMS